MRHVISRAGVGGLIGIAGVGYYNATKFAVEGLSEALAKAQAATAVAPAGSNLTPEAGVKGMAAL